MVKHVPTIMTITGNPPVIPAPAAALPTGWGDSAPHPALTPSSQRLRPAGVPVRRSLLRLAGFGAIPLIGLVAGDWIASVALAVLFVAWKFLSREPGPPIVAAAFSMQWLQVVAGILYFVFTGRRVIEMLSDDYRPMAVIGLTSIVVLFTGFYLAGGFGRAKRLRANAQRLLPWPTLKIAVFYVLTVALSGVLQEVALSTGGLTQVILVFSHVRYVLLFLLVTRLTTPRLRWPLIAAILATEVALGVTGFYGGFREPLVITAIAIFGAMDKKRIGTWVFIGSIAALALAAALIWTAAKPIVRQPALATASPAERLNAVISLTGPTFAGGAGAWKGQADNLVSRLWAIYYAGLAYKRIPAVMPHENGAILWGAIENVLTPRLFFPSKPVLPSQSDEVRKYSGVWVGGREINTSFAFGYVGEAYVDFGLPLMFVPMFILGLSLGFAYRWLNRHIRHDELRVGVTAVIVWSTLGVYEASWVMLIGPSITILAVLGGSAYLLDRTLTAGGKQRTIGYLSKAS
ncbi:MAG TPA: hypothetical protein VES88_05145 [Gemmatimonadaceae bacterium]|nr:hypothetical protein [Gemmatimonadaceae bacterium]